MGGTPRLRLTRARVLALARAFDHAGTGSPWVRGEAMLKARLRRRRRSGRAYLTRAELRGIGEWKSPRIRPQIARNTEVGVRGLTEAAFLARDEARRLRLLLGLPGVGLAVASVMLHFVEPGRYPIYDTRVRAALRGLGSRERFASTPAGWIAYGHHLRRLARRRRVSLRALDKALWLVGGD